MVTTDDANLAAKLRLLRSHGQERKYLHTMLGLNYRMTEVQAAIGLAQLQKLAGWVERRRAHAARLTDLLADLPGVATPWTRSQSEHSYHQYTVVVDREDAGIDRDGLAAALRERGVETAVHYPLPVHMQPVFARAHGGVHLPHCERLADEVLSLPVHPALNDVHVDYVAEAVREAVRVK